jgi:lactoylglutathione lyase
MTITGIGHVALRCRDMEATVAFYVRLGIPVAYRMSRADGSAGEPVFLKVAPGSFLELFSGASGEPDAPERAKTRPGLAHVCLHVEDIHAFHAGITERGVATNGEPRQGRGGNWSFTLSDPNGIGVEVIQLVPGSQMAEAAR